jgi:hypothetical protein
MDPDQDNNLRKALVGCNSQGVGTILESEINLHSSEQIFDHKNFLPAVGKN